MVQLVLTIDIAGWEIVVVSEPMADAIADLILMELTRNPSFAIKKAMKSRV